MAEFFGAVYPPPKRERKFIYLRYGLKAFICKYFKIDLMVLFMFLVLVSFMNAKLVIISGSCSKIMDFFILKYQFSSFFFCFYGE